MSKKVLTYFMDRPYLFMYDGYLVLTLVTLTNTYYVLLRRDFWFSCKKAETKRASPSSGQIRVALK